MFNSEKQSTPIAYLRQLFDYAGLFPPAGLSMQAMVASFHRYQSESLAWMLNTVVVPVERLDEFAAAALSQLDADQVAASFLPVKLSVLSKDWQNEQRLVDQFRDQHASLGDIVSVETRQLADAVRIKESVDRVYVEVAVGDDVASNIQSVKNAGAAAKIRTGGLTAEAFPSSLQVAGFLLACAQHDVSFKATAGLHHPLAKERPTCAEAGAPLARMHGFINVMAAVSLAEENASPEEVASMLSLPENEARAKFCSVDFMATASSVRQRFHSIGSCSFAEPVEDLTELGWLSMISS